MSNFFVYILRTSANTLYTGQTNNLKQRLLDHKSKSSKSARYLKYFDSFELVYSEQFPSRSEAMKRERQLKLWPKSKKEALVVKYELQMKKQRPSWDQYFMDMAHIAKSRSTCVRLTVGAVLVRDKRLLATGYNETPSGTKNCADGGCDRCTKRQKGVYKANEHKDKCICVHAEQNVILQSAYHGVSTKNSTLYSTIMPCNYCAKLLINAGITEVVIDEHHTDKFGLTLFKRAGVTVRQLK